MIARPWRLAPLCFLTLLALAAPAVAAPRDELLRFVPDDVGFCLVVQDLRGQSAQVMDSPFGKAFAKSPLASAIVGSKEWAQVQEVESYLKKHLNIGWAEIRDDLLGDAFVFAYRPGPPGKPEQEQGMFLVRAREAKTLADVVRKLNVLQKKTGELVEVDERVHKDVKYFRRTEKKQTNYYLLRDRVLLFTGQETLLQSAIERDLKLASDAEPALTKRLRDLSLDRALAALVIQPRAFDSAVVAKEGDPASQAVVKCWKALDAVGLGLTIGKEVELSLVLKGKPEQLPPAARRFLTSAAKASELWGSFPDDALFASAGRLDLVALYEFIGGLMPSDSKKAADAELERTIGAMLGKSVIKDVLPALGPDWGVCVTAPAADGKEWTPRIVAAVRVARGDEDAPTDEAVFSGVESLAQMFVLSHNKQHPNNSVALRTTHIDRQKVRYLVGERVFPVGVQPAFGLRQGYLVLGTSPAEIRRFKPGVAPSGTSVPLMRVGVKELRAYLKAHREPLAALLAAKEMISKEKAGERLDDIRASLELIDRLELRQQTTTNRVTFTLAVQPAQPLKKHHE